MYSPSNKILIQSPDDEEDQPEDGDNSISEDSVIKQPSCQETFFSYYNQHFGQTQDLQAKSLAAQYEKCHDFVSSAAVSAPSGPRKISYGRLLQEGLDSASPKLNAKKRKSAVIEVRGGGRSSRGHGRAVSSSGRKDRHSKVSTARGPRDRRVRLSPTTAIEFYDVQDRLGYDRPSKAIDWLIKEAKTAIDSLNQSSPNHGGFLISECGMIEAHEHLNDDNPVSGFSFCVGGVAPSPPAEFQACLVPDFGTSRNGSEASEDVGLYPSDQQGFFSASTATSQILELQKMLAWNYGNENSGNARGAAQPISGHSHTVCQREPLQSSFIKNYSPINTDFPGFSFCDELLNITASAILKEDEK